MKPSGSPGGWQMAAPTPAPTDPTAIEQLMNLLARFRAERVLGRPSQPLASYGLEPPAYRLRWTASGQGGEILVGNVVDARSTSRYAKLGDSDAIYVVDGASVSVLGAEYRDRLILAFPEDQVTEVRLKWPKASATYRRSARPGDLMTLADGTPPRGFTPAQLSFLLKQVGNLRAIRFLQYDGPIPTGTGLSDPVLTIQVSRRTRDQLFQDTVRIGNRVPEGRAATVASGADGPVFALPADEWASWIKLGGPAGELPENVFTAPLSR